MKNTVTLHSFNCVAKQAGSLPTYWSTLSLSNDRTPEIPRVRRTVM